MRTPAVGFLREIKAPLILRPGPRLGSPRLSQCCVARRLSREAGTAGFIGGFSR
jgi:hypothetical protein